MEQNIKEGDILRFKKGYNSGQWIYDEGTLVLVTKVENISGYEETVSILNLRTGKEGPWCMPTVTNSPVFKAWLEVFSRA